MGGDFYLFKKYKRSLGFKKERLLHLLSFAELTI
jgi:hypothetical protein